MNFGQPSFTYAHSRVRSLQLILGLAAMTFSMRAEDAPSEPKTHTLFMGADFSIEQNRKIHKVVGVAGSSFIVNINGKEVSIPTNEGNGRMRIVPALKVTEVAATIANLRHERTYTLNNDPTVLLQRSIARAQIQYADNLAAQNQMNAGFHAGDTATAVSSAAMARESHAPANSGNPTIANQNAQMSGQRISGGPGSSLHANGSLAGVEGNFDAIAVDFEISSVRPLNRPYVVLTVEYHPPDAEPGIVANWIHARELPAVGRDPMKMHIEQGGFPFGYEITDLQIHLYNHGDEVATNVAHNRVQLTRDEAFQYVLSEYLGSHKGATIPATPAAGKLPASLSTRILRGEFRSSFYVGVTTDGKATGLYRDPACAEPLHDAYLADVMKDFRFNPALDKGKPVNGVAEVNLAKLPISS